MILDTKKTVLSSLPPGQTAKSVGRQRVAARESYWSGLFMNLSASFKTCKWTVLHTAYKARITRGPGSGVQKFIFRVEVCPIRNFLCAANYQSLRVLRACWRTVGVSPPVQHVLALSTSMLFGTGGDQPAVGARPPFALGCSRGPRCEK
jgi:hypothetical protein